MVYCYITVEFIKFHNIGDHVIHQGDSRLEALFLTCLYTAAPIYSPI